VSLLTVSLLESESALLTTCAEIAAEIEAVTVAQKVGDESAARKRFRRARCSLEAVEHATHHEIERKSEDDIEASPRRCWVDHGRHVLIERASGREVAHDDGGVRVLGADESRGVESSSDGDAWSWSLLDLDAVATIASGKSTTLPLFVRDDHTFVIDD